MLIDTHCHLDFEWFDADREAVVDRAREAGVCRIVVPAVDLENCQAVLDLADRYAEVFAAVGVHPNSSAGWEAGWTSRLRSLACHPKVVAIGEIGLDYYRQHSPVAVQKQAFREQLNLAAELGLPVIIHNREADDDLILLLKSSALTGRVEPGVLHSFSGSQAMADRAVALGYYLGFTGPVTYRKADVLRLVVARAPASRILVETDAPFLAPQSYRGKRNEPAYVTYVSERIAEIRRCSGEDLARQTSENAIRLFGPKLGL